jgi:hypothetical protein
MASNINDLVASLKSDGFVHGVPVLNNSQYQGHGGSRGGTSGILIFSSG